MCLFLPILLGNAAQQTLSEGVEFSGITMAVTAPEGDPIPQLLEEYMVRLKDVSRYCSFRAMEKEEAILALEAGEVVAVLELPEQFIQGILNGKNPDVTLIVDSTRPVESMLTLWVGQSAADLLSAVQSGIYAVLESYDAQGVAGLDRNQVMTQINMRYLNWTMNRQDVFQLRQLCATDMLSIDTHYALSLLIWLCLCLAPLFFPVFESSRLRSMKRLRSLGLGSSICCLSDVAACALVLLPITALPLLVILKGNVLTAVLGGLGVAVFCALFGSLCCLVTGSAAHCGGLSFLVSLAGLALAGGILPPVMLPQSLQTVSWLSPVTWLRELVAALAGYEIRAICLCALAVAAVAMLTLLLCLYPRRMEYREVTQ